MSSHPLIRVLTEPGFVRESLYARFTGSELWALGSVAGTIQLDAPVNFSYVTKWPYQSGETSSACEHYWDAGIWELVDQAKCVSGGGSARFGALCERFVGAEEVILVRAFARLIKSSRCHENVRLFWSRCMANAGDTLIRFVDWYPTHLCYKPPDGHCEISAVDFWWDNIVNIGRPSRKIEAAETYVRLALEYRWTVPVAQRILSKVQTSGLIIRWAILYANACREGEGVWAALIWPFLSPAEKRERPDSDLTNFIPDKKEPGWSAMLEFMKERFKECEADVLIRHVVERLDGKKLLPTLGRRLALIEWLKDGRYSFQNGKLWAEWCALLIPHLGAKWNGLFVSIVWCALNRNDSQFFSVASHRIDHSRIQTALALQISGMESSFPGRILSVWPFLTMRKRQRTLPE